MDLVVLYPLGRVSPTQVPKLVNKPMMIEVPQKDYVAEMLSQYNEQGYTCVD
jgi:hypothetical protein